MKKIRYYYLIEIQYLGFRFHGWQVQPNVKTVQEMVLKTLNFIWPENNNKVLASSRTDARVSVNHSYIELFTFKEIIDINHFLIDFNLNLPADIRALSIVPTTKDFNIIQAKKIKEYHYYFSCEKKFHPFSASLMCNIPLSLDIELMQKATRKFEGEHDFWSYTYKPNEETKTQGHILSCVLEKNKELTASFFPEKSYVVKIRGIGFKRNQIRLMMGMLFELGRGGRSWDSFIETLDGRKKIKLTYVAPASGLQLHRVDFV